MQNLFYIKTVPHTGTNFIVQMLRYLAKDTIVHLLLDPRSEPEIRECFRAVINNEITLTDWYSFLSENYDQAGNVIKYKNIFIVEHLEGNEKMPEEYKNVMVLRKFERQCYPKKQVKTLMALRDYRKVILTIFLLSVNLPENRKKHLAWSRDTFERMLMYYKHADYMVIPVDLYGQKSIDARQDLIASLFNDFLQIEYNQSEVLSFINDWKPVHSVYENKTVLEYYAGNEEFELLMAFRKDDDFYFKNRNRHAELDAELRYYDEHSGILEMYDYFGYNLKKG